MKIPYFHNIFVTVFIKIEMFEIIRIHDFIHIWKNMLYYNLLSILKVIEAHYILTLKLEIREECKSIHLIQTIK